MVIHTRSQRPLLSCHDQWRRTQIQGILIHSSDSNQLSLFIQWLFLQCALVPVDGACVFLSLNQSLWTNVKTWLDLFLFILQYTVICAFKCIWNIFFILWFSADESACHIFYLSKGCASNLTLLYFSLTLGRSNLVKSDRRQHGQMCPNPWETMNKIMQGTRTPDFIKYRFTCSMHKHGLCRSQWVLCGELLAAESMKPLKLNFKQ